MHRTLHLVALVLGSALVAVGAVAVAPGTAAHAATSATSATAPATGRYTPVDTTRVFSGAVTTTPTVVPISGLAGVPSKATAVVVNVEVKSPTASGYVRVTPAGSDPGVATQEFSAGQSISNLTTVKLSGGRVQVKVSAGSAQVFFDVSGYYADGSGSTYTPVANARVFGETVSTDPVPVPLAGTAGIPADATAVAVNVGTQAQTDTGYVRVTSAGHDPQVAAQVYTPNTAVSNLVIVGLTGGAAQVKVSKGSATVYMDVTGYYSASSTGSVFVPIDTVRAYSGAIGSTPSAVRLSGTAGVPGTATAVVANAEVSGPTGTGYLRVTPNGQDAQVATQNFRSGQKVAALTMPKVVGSTVDRRVQVKVNTGSAHLYLDVSGYFLDGSSGSGTGADISWPQCGSVSTWPTDMAFGVVGVTGGLANNTNPCLSQQLVWAAGSAGGTTQATTQLYVNISNPGSLASVWPKSNRIPNGPTVQNPYGTCTGKYDRACSYVYGYTRAYEDMTIRGISSPTSYRWWMDVETDQTTWQTDKVQNLADVEGMATAFQQAGVQVGLYSTRSQLAEIVGTVPAASPLTKLPGWVAIGPSTLAAAQRACSATPLTSGGRTEMVQYVSGGFDRNVSCV